MTERKIIIGRGAQPPRKHLSAIAQFDPFTHAQTEQIRKGSLSGCLISASSRAPGPDSVRALRRIVRVLDGNGDPTGETRVDTTSTLLTIRSVSDRLDLGALQATHARLCGYSSAQELRAAWSRRHPRILLVRVVVFQCGDVRDKDWFMAHGNGYTSTAGLSIDREAAAVPSDAVAWITANARTEDDKRMARQRRGERVRSAATRAKEANKRGDVLELRAAAEQIISVADELEEAA